MNKKKYIYSKKKKKNKKILFLAHLYVQCESKNTIFSLTKYNGDLVKQWSTKSLKKTKFKKNTPYNVQSIMYKINQYFQVKQIKKINLFIKGSGIGRFNILRNLKKTQKIGLVFENTIKIFNGCRIRRAKRR